MSKKVSAGREQKVRMLLGSRDWRWPRERRGLEVDGGEHRRGAGCLVGQNGPGFSSELGPWPAEMLLPFKPVPNAGLRTRTARTKTAAKTSTLSPYH